MPAITKEMLRDYLNDALPDAEMASVEANLRQDSSIATLLQTVRDEIDRGEHSIGGIWRRERLSCPSRDIIGSYLLKALDSDVYDYVKFHLQTIGCPACQANFDDLEKKQEQADAPTTTRRARIVQSSEPALKKAKKD